MAAHQSYVADPDRYDAMPYRRCGNSGLVLPPISLGLWHRFGDVDPLATQRAVSYRAFDLGITHFDLANNYGPPPGSAEENFGRILASGLGSYRDELIISTKAGYRMWPGPYGEWPSRKNLLASLDQSLARMGLDYVDVFYAHRPDDRIPVAETAGALATAVQQGKALYAGISNFSASQTQAIAAHLRSLNIPIVVNQVRYSMFDREVEAELLSCAESEGLGLVVYSPLAQGLLTDRYLQGIPQGSRATTSHFLPADRINPDYLERAGSLNEIAASRGQTLAQLALQWVLRHPQVTSALIGASSVAQLEANVAALSFPELQAEELAQIEPYAVHGSER